MFKGDLSGYNWTLVNDKLRFSTNLLKVLYLTNGTKRIVSAVNGMPHFSDDDGITWIKSTGVVPTADGWELYDSEVTSDGKIFFLGRKDYNSSIRVYCSFDFGKSFKNLKLFTTSDVRNVSLGFNAKNDNVYVIEQINTDKSNLYKFNAVTKILDVKTSNQSIGFGQDGRANLQVASTGDTTNLFVVNNEQQLFISKDEGKSWKLRSTLPTRPWEVSIYVSPSDPRNILYGEVNAYRSNNGGGNWLKVSEWWEYYGDINNKMHADMMTFKEFKDPSGKPFILTGNHGGIYFSEDYGKTHSNLGLSGLNVSQYYDVKSMPGNPSRVFAGSQDQGQQRGLIEGEETAELFQNVSGDYGHITFTKNGKSLWSVYPGGLIGFYSAPLSQTNPIAGYEIVSSNETVWIPPIISGPDPSKDIILAAGGSTTKTSNGSYIIQLEYKNNDIEATQLPFNFATSGGQISALAINPIDKNKWYVATTNGVFYTSIDGGQQFNKTQSLLSESHYLYGSCILPSAITPDLVYLSGNGYSNKPVYKSVDGGKNFVEMSEGLPKTTVFKIVANEDESLLYAATEAGPYVYIATKGQWYDLSGSITPNQTYWSVEYIPQTKTARFGTYGRGIWDFDFKEISTGTTAPVAETDIVTVFPNPAADFIVIKGLDGYTANNVTIYDIQHKICLRSTLILGKTLDISQLLPGQYIVEVSINQKMITKKLVVL
ncbi:MAG: T9SS type A sorting domain-containing protein [Saprospiraceae bacterium]|nr:T9SS type A sorting domain-containing protein [Saprospiraceae bacterium]